jgi:poly-D-alanine transfer protein DltD
LLAAALLIPALATAVPVFRMIERPYLRELIAQPFKEKDQGVVLQEEALRRRDVVSVYGSSELRNEMDKRPDELFKRKPLGFEVCPIGGAGNTTLMMAQKIAAQGAAVSGQKVVCILSHTWFRRPQIPSDQFAGNFSPLQAIRLVLDPALEEKLRHRFEARLLEFPKPFHDHLVFRAFLNCDLKGGRIAHLEESVLRPLLQLEEAALELEDHLNTMRAIFKYELSRDRFWTTRWRTAGWNRRIKQKEAEVTPQEKEVVNELVLADHGPADDAFLADLKGAREWEDFALLLDTLKSLKADPLIISVPMPGTSLNRKGVSRAARDVYYHRVEKMCAAHGMPVATFADEDLAVDFLEGSGTHLEVKGWLYVDKLLDDFFHNHLPPEVRASADRS